MGSGRFSLSFAKVDQQSCSTGRGYQMNSSGRYQQATQATTEDVENVAKSLAARRLTKLTLPEIEAVADLVGKVIPAGNVPGMILSGLTNISGNHVQPQKARQDINILFREVSLFFEQ